MNSKWADKDAAILAVVRRARRPLKSEEIFARAGVDRMHFDLRLQALRSRGLIEIAGGRTSGASWWARRVDKRKVHGTGTVARSNGNDADCGASGDPDQLLLTSDPKRVTCKRCLRMMREDQR